VSGVVFLFEFRIGILSFDAALLLCWNRRPSAAILQNGLLVSAMDGFAAASRVNDVS
jgi:hypothetical protein